MALLVTLYLSVTVFSLLVFMFAMRFVTKYKPASLTLEDRIGQMAPKAPGPAPFPIIGSLHLLAKYQVPFQAFTDLAKVYGDIYSITLGSVPCLVVNNFALIKEVLISKGAHFGGRPDFIRFHKLFGGDRNNSLALCDWSALQKTRRSIARTYCSPRFTSIQYDLVNSVGCSEMEKMLSELSHTMSPGTEFAIKPLILATCANMFTQYMCSKRFPYEDQDFQRSVRHFDEIFWEINQGYAVDFLPWLEPFYQRHMRQLSTWSHHIRQFILSRIIEERRSNISNLESDGNVLPRDFTDALLLHLDEDPNMNWEHIIFELEDFLGGHSAIGNLLMITLAMVVRNPEVMKRIQQEVDNVTSGKRLVNLLDKCFMPYTEATIWETLRTSSSPIVPHVATVDTMIQGYTVHKGTVVFINNYELNLGEDYWEEPSRFQPERFVSSEGRIVKPAHFIPFSTGKRTCIGQRLVQGFTFIILASLLQRYHVASGADPSSVCTKPGSMAVPPDSFPLVFTPRQYGQYSH